MSPGGLVEETHCNAMRVEHSGNSKSVKATSEFMNTVSLRTE